MKFFGAVGCFTGNKPLDSAADPGPDPDPEPDPGIVCGNCFYHFQRSSINSKNSAAYDISCVGMNDAVTATIRLRFDGGSTD